MFNLQVCKAVTAVAILTAIFAATPPQARAGERGYRQGRRGGVRRNDGREMMNMMRQMNLGGGILADGPVRALKKEWREKILTAATKAPQAVEEGEEGREATVAEGAGEAETPEGLGLLQKENALLLLSIKNLEDKSGTIEAKALNSPPVTAAYRKAFTATRTFYQKLEADPEYLKLKAENEAATEKIEKIRNDLQALRRGGGDRQQRFENMRQMAEQMRAQREVVQGINTRILLLPDEKPELQNLQTRKAEAWIAFEKAIIDSLKDNKEYVAVLKQLESLENWQEKLNDTIDAGQLELLRQRRVEAKKKAAKAEAAPAVAPDPPSVF